jgi:glycosyltransferase involved in cell wall biosynthesis
MPKVSIVIPCYNEQATIGLLLDSIRAQTYPLAQIEVIVADGGSTDDSRGAIERYAQQHPDLQVRLVDNPHHNIPAALNVGIAAAQGEIIVRLDAHSAPYPEYVERSVADLEAGAGDNVGGVWEIRPGTAGWMAASIAAAAAHPLGVGDAMYRHATRAAEVDTVPFGAFRKSLAGRIGPFDEALITNEDYEFNTRIRRAGGHIWLDPGIRSIYFARPTLKALADQYARYGYWKWRMLRRYPGSIRWRQGLPPLFVLGLLGGSLLAIFFAWARWILLTVVLIYGTILLVAGLQSAVRRRQPALIIGLPLAIAVMHVTWGAGFLLSILYSLLGIKSHVGAKTHG